MNRDRLTSIRIKTPTEMNMSTGQVFESDMNWLVTQLDEALADIDRLEGQLTTLATSQYVHDLYSGSKSPKCPECRESIMHMPNDCGTCNDLGKFVTNDSIAKHLLAFAKEVE